jgi:CubicO group peptidase (beta-lactamase class C family)
MANLEYGIANSPSSVFRIGSVSKQFTAAVIVLLAQRGELSLDEDIREYVPELPAYERTITIRHLLHHTSGLRDYLTLMYLAGKSDDDFYTDDELVAMLARQQELNFPPGDQHLYSNSGYFLLSQIVRSASGLSLREYAQQHLFGPLGMTHTHFHDDHTHIVSKRASGYAPSGPGEYSISMTTLGMVGDGGVFTSVEDLLQWERFFHSEASAISPTDRTEEFWRETLRKGVLTNGDTLSYALALGHGEYRGLPMISHGGGFVGFRAQVVRFPTERMSIICLCNVSVANPTRFSQRVADVLLEDRLEPQPERPERQQPSPEAGESEPLPLDSQQKQELAGFYYSGELDITYEVTIVQGELVLRVGNDLDGQLRLSATDEMRRGGVTLRFERSGDGQITGFLLDAGRVRNLRFVKR